MPQWSQYPGAFFYLEPLHYHSTNKDHESELISQHDLLQSLFTCNLTNDTQGFLQHAKSHLFLFNRQVPRRLWNSCVSFKRPKDPIRLNKTVRMKMRDTRHLLETLVRDPRAVFRSRWSDTISSWCRSQQCSDPETSCGDLEQDVNDTETLGDMFPGRVKLVRYEDISLNIVSTLRRVRKKIVMVQDPYTTIRNSTAAVVILDQVTDQRQRDHDTEGSHVNTGIQTCEH